MRVSANEIERVCQKACEALGVAPGVDRDVARAARWLEARDLGGLAALHEGLDAIAGCGGCPPATPTEDRATLRVHGAGCPALAVVPAVLDWIYAAALDGESARAVVSACAAPHTALAAAADRAGERVGFRLAWAGADGGTECVVSSDGSVCLHGTMTQPAADSVELRLEAAPGEDLGVADPSLPALEHATLEARADHALAAGTEVDPDTWAALVATARRVLVPDTEDSRARGAGAGVIDND